MTKKEQNNIQATLYRLTRKIEKEQNEEVKNAIFKTANSICVALGIDFIEIQIEYAKNNQQ